MDSLTDTSQFVRSLTIAPVGAQDSGQMSAFSPSHSLFRRELRMGKGGGGEPDVGVCVAATTCRITALPCGHGCKLQLSSCPGGWGWGSQLSSKWGQWQVPGTSDGTFHPWPARHPLRSPATEP